MKEVMAIFFVLSGFLITRFFLAGQGVTDFIVRRIARIVPLAWLYLFIVLLFQQSSLGIYSSHFLFYANWAPMPLTPMTSHFWSLCVEFQFYIAIAICVAVFGKRALLLVVIAAFACTSFRIYNDVYSAINTYFRVDEILAGGILALCLELRQRIDISQSVAIFLIVILALLFLASCHPNGGDLNYLRPYIASLLVGITLVSPVSLVNRLLCLPSLSYIASISYALYVIHGGLRHTWLGEGDTIEKYLKRPLFFAVLFLFAHLSTFYYEKYWIDVGKKVGMKLRYNKA